MCLYVVSLAANFHVLGTCIGRVIPQQPTPVPVGWLPKKKRQSQKNGDNGGRQILFSPARAVQRISRGLYGAIVFMDIKKDRRRILKMVRHFIWPVRASLWLVIFFFQIHVLFLHPSPTNTRIVSGGMQKGWFRTPDAAALSARPF